MKFFKHLLLVGKHRYLVFKYCCKAGVPLRGLLHDLSKYSITELSESVKYYNGSRSPLDVTKTLYGYSYAWLHHKGRNKHHFEYYVDIDAFDRTPVMPYKYTVEMICDMISAGQTYLGYDWSAKQQLERLRNRRDRDYINVKTFKVIERVYTDMDKYGLDAVLNKKYLKNVYNEIVYGDFKYGCYLGGTCGKSDWRSEFTKLLPESIKCYNPYNENWNHEVEIKNAEIKRDCKFLVYVITSENKGFLSIASLVNLSNKTPNRVLACFIKDGFTKDQLNSIEEVKYILENNRALVFDTLEDLASYVKKSYGIK